MDNRLMIPKKQSLTSVILKSLGILALGLFIAAAMSGEISAEDERWERYQSDTGLFMLNMSSDRKTEIKTLRLSKDIVAMNENTKVTRDQRPFKNSIKHYIIRMDETIGNALSDKEGEKIIARELDRYVAHYRQKNAIVVSKKMSELKSRPVGDLLMTYNDPEFGLLGVRTRILMSDYTRLQLVAVGPEHILQSRWTKDFFDSAYLVNGITRLKGDFAKEWEFHTSPLELFSIYTPPATLPYVPEPVKIDSTDKSDSMSISFFDPLREQKIMYSVHGYKLDGDVITFEKARDFIYNQHVTRLMKIPEGVTFNEVEGAKYPTLGGEFRIPSRKGMPYMNRARIRAFFAQDYIVVQEMLASDDMMQTDLAKNVFNQIEFHPEKGHALFMKKQAVGDSMKPKEETAEPVQAREEPSASTADEQPETAPVQDTADPEPPADQEPEQGALESPTAEP